MGVMVSEIYDAFIDAGVDEAKARAAAAAVPISAHLAHQAGTSRGWKPDSTEPSGFRQQGSWVLLSALVGTAIAVAYFLDRHLPEGTLGP